MNKPPLNTTGVLANLMLIFMLIISLVFFLGGQYLFWFGEKTEVNTMLPAALCFIAWMTKIDPDSAPVPLWYTVTSFVYTCILLILGLTAFVGFLAISFGFM